MNKFAVTARVAGFGPGAVLFLNKEQIASRAHALRELRDDELDTLDVGELPKSGQLMAVERRVQFKRGEVLGLIDVGTINKALFSTVAELDSDDAMETLRSVSDGKRKARAKTRERAQRAEAEDKRRSGAKKRAKRPARPSKTKAAGAMSDETAADQDKG